jgi:glycerol transport system ATP-binding protein
MLGGHTATLHEGRVAQYGVTAEIYRTPNTLLSARVFSDPPINTTTVSKQGDSFVMDDIARWPVAEKYRGMADGSYLLGIRPHHVTLDQAGNSSVKINAVVRVAEISGSESMIRVDIGGNSWVSESHGIHSLDSGESTELRMQVDRCLYFSTDGALVAS